MSKNNIAFCINDGYAPYVAVAAKSIVVNNTDEDIAIHVLTDGISESNRRMIYDAAKPLRVEFHIVDDGKLKCLNDNWGIYAWYRILLPEILYDCDKVLYLDADVIVEGILSPLFEMNMSNAPVAGCLDVQAFNEETIKRIGYDASRKYICSGVLLMNLELWRKENLTDKVISWALQHNDQIKFPDQDTINALFHERNIILPMKYGVLDAYFHYDCFFTRKYREQLLEALDAPVIIHYAGQAPWLIERRYHQHTSFWDKYNELMEMPIKLNHYIEKGHTFKEKLALLLDKLGIRSIKRWYVTPETSKKEIYLKINNILN